MGVVTLFILSIVALCSCEKEELTQNLKSNNYPQILKTTINVNEPMSSYTGEVFYFDSNYHNPFDSIGIKHNILVSELFSNWDAFMTNIEEENGNEEDLVAELFAYAVPRTQELCYTNLNTMGIRDSLFVENLVSDADLYKNLNYSEQLTQLFSINHPNDYLNDFFMEFFTRFYENADLTNLDDIEIKILEQKILHTSSIGESAKNDYLLFLAVYRYSLENLKEWNTNPQKPGFLCGTIKGSDVLADAIAAVKGGIAGAKAGVAGGLVGSAILGTVGAVCGGALGTAVEVGVKQNIEKVIDKGLNNIRYKFKNR